MAENSSFSGIREEARFWTSSENSESNNDQAYTLGLSYNSSGIQWAAFDKTHGSSVRCLRDVTLYLSSSAVNDSVAVCDNAPVTVNYTADPSNGVGGYEYSWNQGEGDGESFGVTYTVPGVYTVTCTITGDGITVTDSISTVVTAGAMPFFTHNEQDRTVTLANTIGIQTISWSDISDFETFEATTHTYAADGTYTITAKSSDNCWFSKEITTCSAEVALTPCTPTAAHPAQTSSSTYTGSPTTPGTGGREEVSGNKIVSVYDQVGNRYPVTQIGNRCWMAENLRTTAYSTNVEASSIPLQYKYVPGDGDGTTYGYLYRWTAAVGMTGHNTSDYTAQGVCPKGWNVPTKAEFDDLTASKRAGDLAKGCEWLLSTNNATPGNFSYVSRNTTGFGALPAGYCQNNTNYDVTENAYFWSRDMTVSLTAKAMVLNGDRSTIGVINSNFTNYYSVRCVRE